MLTALEAKNAKPKEKAYRLADGNGLFLYIAPSGRKTWRYRYEISGKESTYVLGEYPVLTLEAARVKRAELREMVKAGVNPAEARKQERLSTIAAKEEERQRAGNSFEAVATDWIEQQRDRWTAGHVKATARSLELNAFPMLGGVQIDQITPPMVLEVVRAIEARGSLEMAGKALQRMAAVFRYAVQTGRAVYNPAADMRGVLKAKKVRHHPMISLDELPEFMEKVQRGDIHHVTRHAILFTILTAARSGEVRGATWAEIDEGKALWSIPAERMKMRAAHVVPLSRQALAILRHMKTMYGGQAFVFPGRDFGKPLSSNTMLYALYRLGYHGHATMHGFRALFSTVCNEAGYNPDAIERQLAHKEQNAIRAAYHRSEYLGERGRIMQEWADYLDSFRQG